MRIGLLIYSFIQWTSSFTVKLLDLSKYLTNYEEKKTEKKKRRNTVSAVNDNIAISENQVSHDDNDTKAGDNQESRNSTFTSSRDYWNTVGGDQNKSKSNLKKTKSLDYLTYRINKSVEENEHKEIKLVKNNKSSGSERVPNNTYEEVKHETVFINDEEEESSDDLELFSSDDESVDNTEVNSIHFIHTLVLFPSG